MNKIKGSGVLVVCNDNSIALQHRDNIPNISAPNKIADFGGSCEGDESFEDCAIRELFEELELVVDKKDLKFILEFETNFVHKKIYYIEDIKKEDLNLHEGQAIVYVSSVEDYLLLPNSTSCTAFLLEQYFKLKK